MSNDNKSMKLKQLDDGIGDTFVSIGQCGIHKCKVNPQNIELHTEREPASIKSSCLARQPSGIGVTHSVGYTFM